MVAVRLWWRLKPAKTASESSSLVATQPLNHPVDWPLRDLFAYLAPHLPLESSRTKEHITIGIDDKRWEAVGDAILKQLSLGRLHATGCGYRQITRRLQPAPIPPGFWLTAKFTYWFLDGDGSGILDAKNADGVEYSDIEVTRAEALSIWPQPLPASIDRLLDLQDALRQGGIDDALTIWGKLKKWTSDDLMRKEVLEKIEPAHWKEFFVHLFAATQGDNFNTYSWAPDRNDFGRRGYVDLHVDRSQAASWLDRTASSFKGRTKS
jgi:hypothetical protein